MHTSLVAAIKNHSHAYLYKTEINLVEGTLKNGELEKAKSGESSHSRSRVIHSINQFKHHSSCIPDDLDEDRFLNRLPRLKLEMDMVEMES